MTMNRLELIKKNHEQLIELEKLSIANDNQTLEIHKLKEHIEEIYELIAGDNATNWPQDEMIDYIKVLNGQIAEWQDKEDEDDDEITEEEWCKQDEGNYTTDEMNGEEITR
tara:strand:+ start:395 stop:727 length:333 start_codon:yes stop_codon:yes gene_type:complete